MDPSVAGIKYTAYPENGTWTTEFPYGTISGITSCNSITGTWGTAYSSNQNNITAGYQTDGVQCWCRITIPVRSAWVFYHTYDSDSECASACTYACAYNGQNHSGFRTAMYGSAGN